MASPTVEEIANRVRADDRAAGLVLDRYIAETEHLKDTVQAIVEDLGYTMKELDMRHYQTKDLRRNMADISRSVGEHNKVTTSEYERNFRPRFTCQVMSLKSVDTKPGDGKEEAKMEMVVQFPAAEYNDSPHSLMPGQAKIYIMMKENL